MAEIIRRIPKKATTEDDLTGVGEGYGEAFQRGGGRRVSFQQEARLWRGDVDPAGDEGSEAQVESKKPFWRR